MVTGFLKLVWGLKQIIRQTSSYLLPGKFITLNYRLNAYREYKERITLACC